MDYIKRPDVHKCCQWLGHGKAFDLEVKIEKLEGITGYLGKMGYYFVGTERKMVRPGEWVVIPPGGKIYLLTDDQFKKEFVKKDGRGRPKGNLEKSVA